MDVKPKNITKIKKDPSELIKNMEDLDKNELIELRKSYANRLFVLLCSEILALFCIILLNGFGCTKISNISMNIFTGATLTHTFLLVRIVVSKLFT